MKKTIIIIFCAFFAAWLMVNTGGNDSKGNVAQTTNLDNVRVMKSVNGKLVATNPGKGNPPPDYELDLTERCKDWLYWREQILKRHHAGDVAGADEARRTMNTFMRDLEKRFSSQQISEEIARLENDAAQKGVSSWSSAAGAN